MGESERWLQTPVSPPYDSWLKKWLGRYLRARPDIERADCADDNVYHSHCSRKIIFAAFLALLALVIMGLLLFWNYQCIMVWRMCGDDEEPASSSLGNR